MTRAEAMAEIRRLHSDWSLRYGDRVPVVPEHRNPHPGKPGDYSMWQADRSASPEIDDPLNEQIKAILAQIEGES